MKVNKESQDQSMSVIYSVEVLSVDCMHMVENIQAVIVEKLADQIAKDILEKHYVEIMENVSPVAIANLAIARVGARIADTLDNKKSVNVYTENSQRGQQHTREFLDSISNLSCNPKK